MSNIKKEENFKSVEGYEQILKNVFSKIVTFLEKYINN